MKVRRRRFLHLAIGSGGLAAWSRIVRAQTSYPSRPVRIFVGFPPGGTADLVARLTAQRLSQQFGRASVIENRSGAASNIAVEEVVRATPDGYTLIHVTTTNATNAALYDKLSFNFVRDIAPVACTARTPLVMVVSPSFKARAVSEFISLVRANPGKTAMGSAGIGSSGHIAGEWFKMLAGVDMLHVPYGGSGPLVLALLGGQVQVAFDPLPASLEYIREGKLRALAVTTAARSEALPDVPTVVESVPGFEAYAWYGIGAPRATPSAIVDTLSGEINAIFSDPVVKARLAEIGLEPTPMAPAKFAQLVAGETEKWGRVIHRAGIKAQ